LLLLMSLLKVVAAALPLPLAVMVSHAKPMLHLLRKRQLRQQRQLLRGAAAPVAGRPRHH
jgi:hypothetical protein